MAGCLALALVLAARARADCASPSLVAFASSRATRAETRVFEAEQAVVTRGACVTRRGRREAWFALGDDGSTGALREKYCGGGGGSRATLAHNGTRGSAVGGVRDLSFKAVRPYAAATAEGAQRWRLYKRCAPLRRGRPPASEHLELLPATAAQAAAAAGAEWVPGPVVLASDWLSNVYCSTGRSSASALRRIRAP